MVPAERVTRDLGLNRKTVQAQYHCLRGATAEESRRALARLESEVKVEAAYLGGVVKGKRGRGAAGKIPVLGLVKRGGEVRVVFPERVDRANLKGPIKSFPFSPNPKCIWTAFGPTIACVWKAFTTFGLSRAKPLAMVVPAYKRNRELLVLCQMVPHALPPRLQEELPAVHARDGVPIQPPGRSQRG